MACSRAGVGVEGILHPHQMRCPGGGISRHHAAEHYFQLLVLAVRPLDWALNPDDRLTVAPTSRQNSVQKVEVNYGP